MPIIVFGTINILINGLSSQSYFAAFKELVNNYINTLWFLWAIIYCTIAMFCVHKVGASIWMSLSMIILCFIVPDVFNFKGFKFLFPFFLFGYHVNRFSLMEKLTIGKIPLYATILFVVLFILDVPNAENFRAGMSVWVSNPFSQLGIIMYRWIMGLCGCIFVLSILKSLFGRYKLLILGKVLSYFGVASLGIYCIHYYVIEMLKMMGIMDMLHPNIIIWFIECSIVCAITMAIITLMKKWQFARLIFLGGR